MTSFQAYIFSTWKDKSSDHLEALEVIQKQLWIYWKGELAPRVLKLLKPQIGLRVLLSLHDVHREKEMISTLKQETRRFWNLEVG